MKKVAILPDAGPANPFQYQLIQFLRQQKFEVTTAPSKRLFPILRTINKHHPDLIYFDWLQSFFLNRSLIITLIRSVLFVMEILIIQYFYKIPFIHTLHNLHNHAGVWLDIEQRINRFFLPRCRYIRVYSETTRTKIIKLYPLKPDQVVVIQDIPFHFYYPNTISQKEAREYFAIPQQAFVYAFFGAIKPYKGLENLIQSFIQIATPSDYLLIAGTPHTLAYEQILKTLIQKHPQILFFPGFVHEEKVQYFMNAANVMVLPFQNVEHSGSIDLCMSFKKSIITLKTPLLETLLSHQAMLLFQTPDLLGTHMQAAKQIDLENLAQENFRKADTTNYAKLATLFSMSSES